MRLYSKITFYLLVIGKDIRYIWMETENYSLSKKLKILSDK